LFKNTLFLKIILVFTLPALGILYFSSILVYEKIKTLDEIHKIKINMQFISVTEKLIHTIQKERGFSVAYVSSDKFKNYLIKQREITDLTYRNYINTIGKFDDEDFKLSHGIHKIQNEYYEIVNERKNINSKETGFMATLLIYNDFNELLLDSIMRIKAIKYASHFNTKLSTLTSLYLTKENAGIERALTSALIKSKNNMTFDNYNYLVKLYTIQEQNLQRFLIKATISEIDIYHKNIPKSLNVRIFEVRNSLKHNNLNNNISLEQWWELSTKRIDALNKVGRLINRNTMQIASDLEADAYLAQILSLSFLLVSFLTLISLLFVLKTIIFNEQKGVTKLAVQQRIYNVLSKTNNILLKASTEKKLFKEICQLVIDETDLPFGFIAKVGKNNEVNMATSRGVLTDYIKNKLSGKNRHNEQNTGLIKIALAQKSNLIIDDIIHDKISLLSDIAQRYDIKSVAVLPIKKFNEIVAVFVLYSDRYAFFDKEVEILFNKMINDITHSLEKMKYEKTRLEQADELRIASYAFESHEPMLITDKNIKIIKVNNAFCKASGYSRNELIGKNPNILKSDQHDQHFYEKMWSKIKEEGTWSGEIYNKRQNGETAPFRTTITAIKDHNDVVMHYIAQYIDISDQKKQQEILEYQATHDSLTGLPNRLLLMDRINHSLIKVSRHGLVGGLIFIDLDNFKIMNDTLGHDIGDDLLIEVAAKLRKTVREEDTVARIGGDEFIILADCVGKDADEAHNNMKVLTKKIKNSLNSITEISGHKNIVTPSIGATLFSDSSASVNEIIKQADEAMYKAKKAGKNTIEFF